MPISIGAGTAIAAGVGALSSGGQIYAAGKMNKKTREWNEDMYHMQREDALRDWHMQNQYNSWESQIARAKAAGLNPNLLYGQMDSTPVVRPTDVKSWNPETPNVAGLASSALQGIEAYQDYTLQQEQVKNMKAQRDLMELEATLKTIETLDKSFDYSKKPELYGIAFDTAQAKLWQIQNEVQFGAEEAARKRDLHGSNLESSINKAIASRTDAETARAQLEMLKNKGILDKLEIAMREKGMSYNDDLIYRLLVRVSDGKLSVADFVRGLFSNITR